MRILLVTPNYLPFIGGVEAHVRQVAHAMRRLGHEVRIAAVNFAPCGYGPRLAMLHNGLLAPHVCSYMDDGVPVAALTPSRSERVRLLPTLVRAIPRLQRLAYHRLDRMAYRFGFKQVFVPRLRALAAAADVVHSFGGGHLGWATQAAAHLAAVPFIVTPFVHPGQWGDGPEDAAYYRRSDAVIGLIDTDRRHLQSLGVPAQRLHTIGVSPDLPGAADPDGFRQRHGIGSSPLVLYVGRMMPQKGASAVIAAASNVWSRFPDARFVFIGPASPVEAAQFGLADRRIRYLGKVSAQEKADALAACDLFCMPSTSEILPTVYLEAWSYGKAVVGGLAHGLKELVEGNCAGLSASQDADDVATAIARLLGDATLRDLLGRNGRVLVEREYSVGAVSTKLATLYGQLASEAARLQ